jgi:hypothetical protein
MRDTGRLPNALITTEFLIDMNRSVGRDVDLQSPAGLLSEDPKGAPRPRSARVNTLRCTVEEAIRLLAKPPSDWGECRAFKAS